MTSPDLFPESQIAGVFRGFREGGMEFHADLALPYRNDFQSKPMHGQFLLVMLETPDEAVLGRVASFSSEGRLARGAGEEFNIRAVQEGRAVPEDLREQYLRYKVNIRVLGVLRRESHGLVFVASHRRLPHVGSAVAFPSPDVLREIIGHNSAGAPIGHFALGEYVYGEGSEYLRDPASWMQVLSPTAYTRFPIASLVSRRSFIFARAGFGKSNLTKLLFSTLYGETPMVEKRGGRDVPVGTVIFDPDGEYFWPDDKGRPGLCDVPDLEDKLVVFTSRRGPSDFYESFVAGGVKLDIRRLKPADVISIALPPEKQDQQNVIKLRGLNQDNWSKLVDLIDTDRNNVPTDEVAALLHLDASRQEMEAIAARSNMTAIVRQIHDKSSLLMDRLVRTLQDGKLCVVDVSQMRGTQALILSGLILRRIFERNQDEFIKAEPQTIPTIAVIEEAQTVLNDRSTAAEPYIAWVKEGRKYDLGALMITQQPGSIPNEILSQGDNWFIFHLLSAGDLANVRKANAHFSDDILSGLLNEPIPGHGVFWSSVEGAPYPIAFRAFLFEQMYSARDPDYTSEAAETYASRLRAEFDALAATVTRTPVEVAAAVSGNRSISEGVLVELEGSSDGSDGQPSDGVTIDTYAAMETQAVEALRSDRETVERLKADGCPWGGLKAKLRQELPEVLNDRDQLAFDLVPRALDAILGPGQWHSFTNERTGKTWAKVGPKPE